MLGCCMFVLLIFFYETIVKCNCYSEIFVLGVMQNQVYFEFYVEIVWELGEFCLDYYWLQLFLFDKCMENSFCEME